MILNTNERYFRQGQDMEVILDGKRHESKVHGTYHQLDTSDTIMLGTSNNNLLVQDLTRGHFTQGFQVIVSCHMLDFYLVYFSRAV